MPKFNSYTNLLAAVVAATDELGLWDDSASEFKNVTADELRQYIINNSTIDADTLGTLTPSQFLRSDQSDTLNGDLTLTGGSVFFDNHEGIWVTKLDGVTSYFAFRHNANDDLVIGSATNTPEVHVQSSTEVHLKINSITRLLATSTGTKTTGIHEVTEGIKFPATQVPSADPNTVDDYEEGVWTPALFGTTVSGDTTFTSQVGHYEKIGRNVTCRGRVEVNTQGTLAGNVRISGLPFTSSSTSNTFGTMSIGVSASLAIANGTSMSGYVLTNSTIGVLTMWDQASGTSNLLDTELTDGAIIVFVANYMV